MELKGSDPFTVENEAAVREYLLLLEYGTQGGWVAQQMETSFKHLHDKIFESQRTRPNMSTLPTISTIKKPTMPNITIDNIDYDLDTLSDEAKAQLASLQFVDAEIQRLNNLIAILQTARIAYSKALQQALPAFVGDTMKFN